MSSVKVLLDEKAWETALHPALEWPALLPGTRFAVEDAAPNGERREITCPVIAAEELAEYFHRAANHFAAASDPRATACRQAERDVRDAIARASGVV